NRHLSYISGRSERRFGHVAQFVDGHVGGNFDEGRLAVFEIDDGVFGDEAMHAADAGQGEGAFFEELGFSVLVAVLHDDDHALGADHQVHAAAHAFYHLAGDDPVGQVALLGDLHGTHDGQVDVAAADHAE